jgi:hypothetical protein
LHCCHSQVGDGLTDFTPSPEESRAIISAGYACPATLLVQFENDNFDETPEMQKLLSNRQAGITTSSSTAAAATAIAAGSDGSTRGVSVGSSSVPQSGYTSAWNSIDEDVSMDNLLQQLQDLQSAMQSQEQQRQQQPGGVPELQQMLLPGSHVTPCGAQLQGSFGPSPFDVLLSSTSGPDSQADMRILSQKVLGFLDNRRPAAVQRRAGMQQQWQQQQQQQQPAAALTMQGVEVVASDVSAASTEAAAAT